MSDFLDADMNLALAPVSGEDEANAARTLNRCAARAGLDDAMSALGIDGTIWIGDLAGWTVSPREGWADDLQLAHQCGIEVKLGAFPYLADLVSAAREHECEQGKDAPA